ncbi:MAG: hypothetical protein HJJLKODD_02506 [Phycisphaerae bacterium]|nr:hypothetical protein [Phycisphaerae bacterium]
MPDTNHTLLLEQMADELFQMQILSYAMRSRSRKQGTADLSETEFLTLDLLNRLGSMTVGELQKHIGVLPAQMSRIVRALEGWPGGGLIRCKINPRDKRRVDVEMTKGGAEAHQSYRSLRRQSITQMLGSLSSKDCREFMRICRIIRNDWETLMMSGS